jgi:hypothetical protein
MGFHSAIRSITLNYRRELSYYQEKNYFPDGCATYFTRTPHA